MPTIQITIPHDQLRAFCERHPIRKLSLFGSVLRVDFGPDSDIDMLVEFQPDARITLLDMVSMELELTAIMGRKVDFRTPQELSRYFRQQVLDTAEVVYERTG
ncbi:MAG: nucleotidyltransferase family protein [Anaerolineae bacterium]|nr:nucleotidyltransferase family protein [Anaerolineae bacterium]